ncbi:MAG: hypothetical protein IKM23_04715, partial [Bacteroidales bacterium]|nr:hypothetical protein [Bacteroidales bacterium]
MTRKIILLTVLMSLVVINSTFSQEWQFSIEPDSLEGYVFYENVTELSNGNLLIPCSHAIRNTPQE